MGVSADCGTVFHRTVVFLRHCALYKFTYLRTYICTVARDIQTASQDISLSLVIPALNLLISSLLHCGP